MKKNKLSHVDDKGNPRMVDVSAKQATRRTAKAQATVHLGGKILREIKNNELITRKGPVFQTAIIAGVMAAKKTSGLIPFCHPIGLEDCNVQIHAKKSKLIIDVTATVVSKTGVEMEALTAVTVAALTVYDMCKSLSHHIIIGDIKLMEKTGGKKDFSRPADAR